jgi:hypothetical protein
MITGKSACFFNATWRGHSSREAPRLCRMSRGSFGSGVAAGAGVIVSEATFVAPISAVAKRMPRKLFINGEVEEVEELNEWIETIVYRQKAENLSFMTQRRDFALGLPVSRPHCQGFVNTT